MIRYAILPLLLACSTASGAEIGSAPKVSAWHVKSSPHFEVLYEAAWSPNSISLELEKMYSTMRLNLSMFAPWMSAEKAKIYIYASQNSYAQGEFSPPNGRKGWHIPQKKPWWFTTPAIWTS